MPKRRKAASRTWKAFLDSPLKDLVSIDFFAVPTATFRVLFVLVVLPHSRRRVVHCNVTEHPRALNRRLLRSLTQDSLGSASIRMCF
jgi:hypothetical protein